jgi:transposase
MSSHEVRIRVVYDEALPVKCPECGKVVQRYDRKKRRWRHLDTCQMKTIIECEVPRVKCPTHDVKQMDVPWAERHSHFTALYELMRLVIKNGMNM